MTAVKKTDLLLIYTMLNNEQKREWAKAAGYDSYRGLYHYLTYGNVTFANQKVINGLIQTVGEDAFNELLNTVRSSSANEKAPRVEPNKEKLAEKTRKLAEEVLNCTDVDDLREMQKFLPLLVILVEKAIEINSH
jgi:hypothetical protein